MKNTNKVKHYCYYCNRISTHRVFDEMLDNYIFLCDNCLKSFGNDDNLINDSEFDPYISGDLSNSDYNDFL